MDANELAKALSAFPAGNLCNADPRIKALGADIRPLSPGVGLAGPAITAEITPGQNAAIHRAVHSAVHSAGAGQVLVVSAGGNRDYGPFGDILASACQQKGIVGLVIDGTVRDTAEIKELGFPVFCLGANPTATTKDEPGKIDIEIACGAARVSPGDIIVGDEDGVVVIPQAIASDVLKKVQAIAEKEEKIKARLEAGETTCDIFNIKP